MRNYEVTGREVFSCQFDGVSHKSIETLLELHTSSYHARTDDSFNKAIKFMNVMYGLNLEYVSRCQPVDNKLPS